MKVQDSTVDNDGHATRGTFIGTQLEREEPIVLSKLIITDRHLLVLTISRCRKSIIVYDL